ncbi:MAG: RDD family protein [Thermomicrobiales bacterium]|nr:RDD family protein [Thermomicrobiales bacterium]
MQLASTSKRVIAYIIDAIVVGVAVVVAVFILEAIGLPDWIQGIAGFVLFYGYFSYMEGTTGQTIGKRAMGIRVIRTNGSPMSFDAALIRNLLRIVDSIFFGLVGLILIMVTQRKQRLGDMGASTIVVDA